MRLASPLMGLRRSQFVLGELAVRDKRQCLLAQPSLDVGHAPGKRPTGLVIAFLSDGPP
jgi:hypothetical protein